MARFVVKRTELITKVYKVECDTEDEAWEEYLESGVLIDEYVQGHSDTEVAVKECDE